MNQTRSPVTGFVRVPALGVPLALLAYGVLRALDRIGGTDQSGPLWVAGHACFLAAIIGIGTIDILVWRELARSTATDIAETVGLAGCAVFAWVILGDIFASVHSGLPVPDVVTALGPIALVYGLAGLLAIAAHRGRFEWSHVALVVLAFGCISVSLALLPLTALLLLLGFQPLRSATHRSPAH